MFTVSTQKIGEVRDVLLETGKSGKPCIIKNPVSLMYRVAKRYKPRLQVSKALEQMCLINEWPAIATIGTMTNKTFCQFFHGIGMYSRILVISRWEILLFVVVLMTNITIIC